MDSEKKSNWCGDCEKGWVKKDAYKKHFTLETVRSGQGSGGKLIPNMCLNRKRKSYSKTLTEAIANKKSRPLFTNDKNVTNPPSQAASSTCNSTSEDKVEELLSDEILVTDNEPVASESSSQNTSDVVFENISGTASKEAEEISDDTIDQPVTLQLSAQNISEGCVSSTDQAHKELIDSVIMLNSKVDQLTESVKEVPKKVKDILKPNEQQQFSYGMAKREEVEKSLGDIKRACDMKTIMDNILVKNILSVYTNEEDETEYLKCNICEKWESNPNSYKNLGIMLVEGSDYSIYHLGLKKVMSRAFSNFKTTLARHIESQSHQSSLKLESEYNYKNKDAKESIANAMRQHAYFALKSNMPFNQFENYCATSVSSGLDIGNINHSRFFIEKFLELVNTEVIKKDS